MGLGGWLDDRKDDLIRSVAFGWLKRRIDALRKGGSPMLRLLDGNKRLVLVLGFIISGFVALLTGQDVSQWLDLILRAIGWQDADIIGAAKETATVIVPMIWAIWAGAHGLWKMWKQHRAGATASEIGSPAGVVKAAVKDGSLRALDANPVILEIDGAVVSARPVV